MRFGIDYLGLPKFSDLAIREHPEGWAAGCFAVTFGNALPHVDRLLATGRCPLFRVQLLWSDSHTFGASDVRQVKVLSRQYQALAKKYPAVEILISPFCEHNIREPDKFLDIVSNEAPDCAPVNVPWNGGYSTKYINEVHGTKAPPKVGKQYLYSWDGTSCVDGDVERSKAIHAGSEVYFFWHPAMNGRLNTNDKTPRPQRKAWPTSELIDSLIYLKNDGSGARLPRNYLWKSHADRHMTPPEPRAYKPVLIAPVKADRAELVADNGQVIAVSSRSQPFNDGRFRYYFGEYGYQLAEKAMRIHGKRTASLRMGGKIVGVVSCAFRGGSFR